MKTTTTVLLIDDDTDDQEIFSYAMMQADPAVACVFANDGILALEKIHADESFIPDYIFIDMNMPRMNGQQCLSEIKKIDRLKNKPVYMYSTSAEPGLVADNLKLGAVEFLVKPADIRDLTDLLRRIVKHRVVTLLLLLSLLWMVPGSSNAQSDSLPPAKELKKLTVEDLMNITVMSVSRAPEKLSEVASAIQVVTNEEIRRSGTLRLPGALRLATNLQVASSGAHDIRITSRGFNGYPINNSSLANKLLVQIDGRSVYTPLFGGVYWDVQNVLQEDIQQIEVISGPGGAQWGANAVNGIINILSKSARETQGIYASGAAGGQVNGFGAARFGSRIDTSFYYRAYVQHFDFASTSLTDGTDAMDAWHITQGGFRSDYYPSAASTFTFQGDLYDGTEDDTASTLVNGQNLLARWTHRQTEQSGMTVQAYFDRTYRNIQADLTTDELVTFDFDFQHNFLLGQRHRIVWGLGYRAAVDEFHNDGDDFVPPRKTLLLYSGFIQDQIALVPEHLELTLGTKVLHNSYTQFEYHPTVRLAWLPNVHHTVWGAVSQAVRIPTRFERDNPAGTIGSFGDFQSEKVLAYELGYRTHPAENLYFSFATFYNQYRDLRSIDTNKAPPPPFYFGNNLEATTYGFELSGQVYISDWWKIRGGYSWIHENFTTTASTTFPQSSSLEAIDPDDQFLMQSMMDVFRNFQVDGTFRYVGEVPAALDIPAVPSYITFDLRLGYVYKWITLSLMGSNLAEKYHGSAGNIRISRNLYGRITVLF